MHPFAALLRGFWPVKRLQNFRPEWIDRGIVAIGVLAAVTAVYVIFAFNA